MTRRFECLDDFIVAQTWMCREQRDILTREHGISDGAVSSPEDIINTPAHLEPQASLPELRPVIRQQSQAADATWQLSSADYSQPPGWFSALKPQSITDSSQVVVCSRATVASKELVHATLQM